MSFWKVEGEDHKWPAGLKIHENNVNRPKRNFTTVNDVSDCVCQILFIFDSLIITITSLEYTMWYIDKSEIFWWNIPV